MRPRALVVVAILAAGLPAVGGCSCRQRTGCDAGTDAAIEVEPPDVPFIDGGIAISDLCRVFVDDYCAARMACWGGPFCSFDHCRAQTECYGMDALLSEIAMGWANYDPLGAAACHNLFAQNPCGFGYAALLLAPSIQLALASCPGLIAGNRLPGETCASSADCVAGYACTAFLTVCPGTCTPIPGPPGPPPPPPPPPSEGDPCGSGGCGSTTYCSSAGFCRLRRGEGGFCTDNAHCQAGLTCLPGEVCGPVSGGGDPCDDDLDCCTDLWCRGTTCSALPGLGEPCTPGSPPRCANGLACWGPGGICAQAPRALCPGDDCTVANTTCIASICAGGICQTGAYLGDPCAVNSDCASRSCPAGVCADGYACLP